MTCDERWPFSSWATVSAAITADCFCSGGYLATAWSIFLSESALNTCSPVDLAENDVLSPDDRHHVSEHMALCHLVARRRRRYRCRIPLSGARLRHRPRPGGRGCLR